MGSIDHKKRDELQMSATRAVLKEILFVIEFQEKISEMMELINEHDEEDFTLFVTVLEGSGAGVSDVTGKFNKKVLCEALGHMDYCFYKRFKTLYEHIIKKGPLLCSNVTSVAKKKD